MLSSSRAAISSPWGVTRRSGTPPVRGRRMDRRRPPHGPPRMTDSHLHLGALVKQGSALSLYEASSREDLWRGPP